jgi:hypothetical protein
MVFKVFKISSFLNFVLEASWSDPIRTLESTNNQLALMSRQLRSTEDGCILKAWKNFHGASFETARINQKAFQLD